jgi:hypothetical protein
MSVNIFQVFKLLQIAKNGYSLHIPFHKFWNFNILRLLSNSLEIEDKNILLARQAFGLKNFIEIEDCF